MNSTTLESANGGRLPRGVLTDRIYRILLSSPEPKTAYKIAQLAQAHDASASFVLRLLNDNQYMKGTRVTNPKGILQEWAKLRVAVNAQTYALTNEMEVI